MGYFHTLNETRRRLNVRYATFWAIFQSATDHLGDIATAVMVLMAGSAIAQGDFTIGDFALFTTYLFFAARFPANIGSYLSEIAQQRVVLERVQALAPEMPPADLVTHGPIYEKSARPNVRPADKPPALFITKTAAHRLETLTIRGLTYRYPTNDHAPLAPRPSPPAPGIFDVDLTLPRGSFTVVTGRIGAGKTTLLRVLLGLLPRDAGEIRWNGTLGERSGRLFPTAARGLYAPGSTSLQRIAARQHPDGAAGSARRPGGRCASGRAGDGRGAAGARPGYRGWAARGAPFRRAGAAQRRGAHVCARRRAAGVR
jgi:ATP-binding cassette, subfamily B, bacterial